MQTTSATSKLNKRQESMKITMFGSIQPEKTGLNLCAPLVNYGKPRELAERFLRRKYWREGGEAARQVK